MSFTSRPSKAFWIVGSLLLIGLAILGGPLIRPDHGPAWKIILAKDATQIGGGLSYYGREHGPAPGSIENAQLIRFLSGENPKGENFIDGEDLDLSSAGEVVDPWGTPFRFHSDVNGTFFFDSAGPDKTFGTSDDWEWAVGPTARVHLIRSGEGK